MTYLEQYKQILLDELLDLYGEENMKIKRDVIYQAREIVYNSQPNKEWILLQTDKNNQTPSHSPTDAL